MRAVDTNVVVRLIVRDDAPQTAAAERFIRGGVWLSVLGLADLAHLGLEFVGLGPIPVFVPAIEIVLASAAAPSIESNASYVGGKGRQFAGMATGTAFGKDHLAAHCGRLQATAQQLAASSGRAAGGRC